MAVSVEAALVAAPVPVTSDLAAVLVVLVSEVHGVEQDQAGRADLAAAQADSVPADLGVLAADLDQAVPEEAYLATLTDADRIGVIVLAIGAQPGIVAQVHDPVTAEVRTAGDHPHAAEAEKPNGSMLVWTG